MSITRRLTDNSQPYPEGTWGFEPLTRTMVFDGGTANDPGDESGTGNPADLFVVTGIVEARIYVHCTVDLEGATATFEVGIAGDTDLFVATTTGTDTTDAITASLASGLASYLISTGTIIQTVAVADITAGTLVYTCEWMPRSAGATVAVAS